MRFPRPIRRAIRALFPPAGPRSEIDGLPVQAAALPWRVRGKKVEILLVTSLSSGQWIPPKGHPMKDKTLAQAAAVEAFEEAGVRGSIEATALGSFRHLKSRWLIGPRAYRVVVHALQVEDVLSAWPEDAKRQRRWFTREEAAEVVQSAELSDIIHKFASTQF